MPKINHNGGPTYQGEVMLLGWSENNRDGMTVRLALDSTDEGDAHRFKGLGTGKHGQRFMAVLVPVDDDGENVVANEPVVGRKPRTPWGEMSRAKQAGIRCDDPSFQAWINHAYPDESYVARADNLNFSDADLAAAIVRKHCGVASRSELDADYNIQGRIGDRSAPGSLWDALDAQFRVDTGQIAEKR